MGHSPFDNDTTADLFGDLDGAGSEERETMIRGELKGAADPTNYLEASGDPSENGAVLARAAEDWPGSRKAVESVPGAPTWTGPWDAADFPEPPHPSYWPGCSFRLVCRRPYGGSLVACP